MAAQRTSLFTALVSILGGAMLLADVSVAKAQSISWNTGSPVNLGNGRFNASGTWSLPAFVPPGPEYTLEKIELWYRTGNGAWNHPAVGTDSTMTPWSWTYTNVTPLAASTYEMYPVLYYIKKTSGMPPTTEHLALTGATKTVAVTNP